MLSLRDATSPRASTLIDRVKSPFVTAVATLGPERVYWAGRLTLCGEPDDLPVYDRIYARFFGGLVACGSIPGAQTGPSSGSSTAMPSRSSTISMATLVRVVGPLVP